MESNESFGFFNLPGTTFSFCQMLFLVIVTLVVHLTTTSSNVHYLMFEYYVLGIKKLLITSRH